MTDYPNNVKYFYKDPSFEKYVKIRRFIDSTKTKTKNKTNYALFLYVIHMKYPTYESRYRPSFMFRLFSSTSTPTTDIDSATMYRHIIGDPALLSMTDIDMLWLCFYATGDTIYSNQVKSCALIKKQILISDAVIRTAAEWSYNNHIIQKFIHGPEITKTVVTASVTDPLFFYPDKPTQQAIMDKYKDE